MIAWLQTLGWLIGLVYATIPAYWLLVHPLVEFWRRRGISLRHVGPVWGLLWVLAGLATASWRHSTLYQQGWTWIPGVTLIALALRVYMQAGRDFSSDQVLGRSELEPEKHEQRLVTTGIRGRVRHPYYLAHLCHLLGWTVGTGSAALWSLSAFGLITGVVMVRAEERELVRRFGEAYREYQRTVPALLPRL